jgi:glycerol-3-phosphate dehydrogenase
LKTAQRFLAKKTYSRRCIICFAGLRPLAAPEKKEKTKEVSRSQPKIVSETGLITITEGTTYRKIAEDIIDKAITVRHLPKRM